MTAYRNIMVALLTSILFSSCQAIGDIFSAGVWVGITIVVIVLIAIVAIFARKK